MVSFIQSNYMGFGSGIVVPEHRCIALQNRGAGFTLEAGPPQRRRRAANARCTPSSPRWSCATAEPIVSFGVMGGHMQPQGHVQMVTRICSTYGQGPQQAVRCAEVVRR